MSNEQALTTHKHANDSGQHGQTMENCGKAIKEHEQNGSSHGKLIEEYSQAAQKHARLSQSHAKAAQKGESKECVQAEIEHGKESELHIKTLKEYLKLIKDMISRWQEFL